MPVKLGGGDSSGTLTKSSFTATNAISAGDPVLIDGSGKVLKQTASGPTAWSGVGTGARFLHYNNTGNAFGYHWSRIDAASGRVAYIRNKPINSNTRRTVLAAGTCTQTSANVVSFSTNISFSYGQTYGVNGRSIDVIYDSINGGWIELGYKDSSTANLMVITKWKVAANGLSSTAYMDPTITNNNDNKIYSRKASLVKDDTGKIYAVGTGAAGTNYYGWHCRRIDYSADAQNSCTFGTALNSTNSAGNYHPADLCATFDSLNDQIVVIAASGNETIAWAIDVAANGDISQSHTVRLSASAGVDGSAWGEGMNSGENSWKSIKCDSKGCLAAVSHQGAIVSFKNTGSAFTTGTLIRQADTGTKGGIAVAYASGMRVQGINVLEGAADTFCVPYLPASSGTQTMRYYFFKVNTDGTISKTVNSTPTSGHSYIVTGSYATLRGYNILEANNNHDVGGTQHTTLSSDGGSYFEYLSYNKVFITNLDFFEYLGLAEAAISADASGDITLLGGVNEAQSNKVAGKEYYLNNDGTVTDGSGTLPIGTAISPTKILVGKKLTPGTDLQPASNIKSIQRGYVTSTDTSFTVSITEVDPQKSFLNFSSNRAYSGTFYAGVHPRGTLTDGTTITFNGGGSGQSIYISWEVIEYV